MKLEKNQRPGLKAGIGWTADRFGNLNLQGQLLHFRLLCLDAFKRTSTGAISEYRLLPQGCTHDM